MDKLRFNLFGRDLFSAIQQVEEYIFFQGNGSGHIRHVQCTSLGALGPSHRRSDGWTS